MTSLINKKCTPCKAGDAPLSTQQCQIYLHEIPGWALSQDSKSLERRISFKNYYETIAFVNALAWIAHHEDHHPDLEVHYNHCLIRYSTHTVQGLSENDFICAAKVNGVLGE